MFYKNMLLGDPQYGGFPTILFLIVLTWSIFWKGMALWRSAKNDQKYWFIAMLVISSVGILEIAYLAFLQPNAPILKRLRKSKKAKK